MAVKIAMTAVKMRLHNVICFRDFSDFFWRLCRMIFAWVIISSRVVVLFALNKSGGILPLDMANNSSSDLSFRSLGEIVMMIFISS